ncbi:MAG: TIGR02391 family protein [Chloroflexi bacterium]|nr:TIGR02391 family protein [Chloroflexota bacterium]
MNLSTHIKKDLWSAIQSTYESANYNHAILDAMHYLSDVLRQKTGVDGDGATLVGQALGGDSPRLRINKLQTETEKNEQRGLENILRGMYQAIRNPRSHEQIEDQQGTADAIIYFINYVLTIIERSEEPFVLSQFMTRVFDADFVKSKHYAELLTNEVPTNKLFDTLVTVYRDKLQGDIYSVGLIVHVLISKLSDDQMKQYLTIVSDEMGVITDEKDIRYNLHLLPPSLWEQISEISRLRIENRVLRAIKDGMSIHKNCQTGALATWVREHFRYFALKDQVGAAFLEKIQSNISNSKYYVAELFLPQLPVVILSSYQIQQCIKVISDDIRGGDRILRKALVENIYSLPENWQSGFVESLKDITNEDDPQLYLPDGTPFLKSEPLLKSEPPMDEENIPF